MGPSTQRGQAALISAVIINPAFFVLLPCVCVPPPPVLCMAFNAIDPCPPLPPYITPPPPVVSPRVGSSRISQPRALRAKGGTPTCPPPSITQPHLISQIPFIPPPNHPKTAAINAQTPPPPSPPPRKSANAPPAQRNALVEVWGSAGARGMGAHVGTRRQWQQRAVLRLQNCPQK